MTASSTHAFAFGLCIFLTVALTGCGSDYSPNTYNGSAVQQANKVDTGIVISYREVKISDDGTVGAVTGGAAGGILGAETGSPAALAALGGTVVGGVIGSTIQHAAGDTTGWEYIVREPKGDLISVTQREAKPIPIGQKVLVIEGKQARIVPDYATAAFETPPTPKAEEKHDQDKPAATDSASARTAMPAAGAPSPSAAGDTAGAAAAPPSADKDRLPSNQPAPASAGSGNEPAAPPS